MYVGWNPQNIILIIQNLSFIYILITGSMEGVGNVKSTYLLTQKG